jgi:hypothetical protein
VSFDEANEREVREATARWLLPDLACIGGLLAEQDVGTAAGELHVTLRVLTDRLCTLNEREEDELAEMLKPTEAAA